MSCCIYVWNTILTLGLAASLVIGIYAMVKVNENSPDSIECDMCKELFDIGDVCDSICNNEKNVKINLIEKYFDNL